MFANFDLQQCCTITLEDELAFFQNNDQPNINTVQATC